VVPLAAGWLNATFLALTMHGWWFAGRQVVVVLPCLVLAVAWWADAHAAVRALVAVGAVFGAITFAWLVGGVLAGSHTLIVDFTATANPLYRVWRVLLPDGTLASSGTDLGRGAWCAVIGVLALLGWRSARSPAGSGAPATRSAVPTRRAVNAPWTPVPVTERTTG
jgi:hypothetical protein